MPSPPFELVVICTGNRFRSPLLEALLRARLDPERVHIRSLGTLDIGPRPAYDEAIALGRRYGVDLSSHRSRCLVGEDMSATELCIGFERQHIVKAVVEARLPRERGFLVLPLVQRLAQEELPPAGDQAEHARAALLPLRDDPARLQQGAELEDPAGGSPAVFERVADELDRLATELAALLFGARAPRLR